MLYVCVLKVALFKHPYWDITIGSYSLQHLLGAYDLRAGRWEYTAVVTRLALFSAVPSEDRSHIVAFYDNKGFS